MKKVKETILYKGMWYYVLVGVLVFSVLAIFQVLIDNDIILEGYTTRISFNSYGFFLFTIFVYYVFGLIMNFGKVKEDDV